MLRKKANAAKNAARRGRRVKELYRMDSIYAKTNKDFDARCKLRWMGHMALYESAIIWTENEGSKCLLINFVKSH